ASVPVEEAGLLLIQNETPADGVRSAVARAAAAGVPVIWNPAPIDDQTDPDLEPEQIAWVTPNEVECAVLLGRPGERIEAESAADAASELLEMGYGGAVLTLGPAGVLLAEPGSAPTLVPAPKVEAVDTTGAGDAFNGAFAAALLASSDSRRAARFGVRYASDSVTRHGTQTSFARW
ncbi:MAG: PfkB family carbohydrate kinase, partial [Acidobacteria bacterium]|nr:PfkB family carbohydrate kinase [Acidobacteriota bacterium]